MSNPIRIRLFFPLCLALFAATGILLHAAPIQKLPDEEPEESSSAPENLTDAPEPAADEKDAEKNGTKTESEVVRKITARLDQALEPYLPIQAAGSRF